MRFRCCEGCDARRAYEIAHQYQEGNLLFYAALFFKLERRNTSFSCPLLSYYWLIEYTLYFRLMSEKCGRPNLLRMMMQCLWPQELQGIMGGSALFSWWKCAVSFLKLWKPEFYWLLWDWQNQFILLFDPILNIWYPQLLFAQVSGPCFLQAK